MSNRQLASGEGTPLDQSSVLADPRKRQIIALLLDLSRPIPVRDLAVELAGQEAEPEPSDLSDAAIRSVQIDLMHRCVPKLDATGWVGLTPDGIVAAEPPPIRDVKSLRTDLRNRDQTFWQAIGTVVAVPRRSKLAALIARQTATSTIDDLEAKLRSDPEFWEPSKSSTSLRQTLHHVDLPQLAEAGLITYDADRHTVTRRRRLSSVVDWLGLGSERTKG
ncbi:DUF7344 domain-containing protein [Halovenus marina]|uniref:DUF7344 domain-containing protein n=1 Tax=Halovenus marina TaxID=3396621 RepID=UPI003F570E58